MPSKEEPKTGAIDAKKDVEIGLADDQRVEKAQWWLEDPVKLGRCSAGQVMFGVMGAAGTFFFGYGYATEDMWEMITAGFLTLQSVYTSCFLGGDPCLIEAFRAAVNELYRENRRFSDSNTLLEGKLVELSYVSVGLGNVQKQLGSDLEAAKKLLEDMERFSTLELVSAVVNQFYAADFDDSGHISGEEANIFLPQLTRLWHLVPGFNKKKVMNNVSKNGLTLVQLSIILDALVADDPAACRKELDSLCGDGVPAPQVLGKRGVGSAPAQLEGEVYEAYSMTPGAAGSGKEPQQKGSGCKFFECYKGDKDEVLHPWCMICGLNIWSMLHLVFIVSAAGSVFLMVMAVIALEMTNIVVATMACCLATGLMGAIRLLEVLKALRREVSKLRHENARLEGSNRKLSQQVAELVVIQRGFEKLQSDCGGSVKKAQELIRKSNMSVKMSAMAVVTRLFKEADTNHNFKIDKDEVNGFVDSLAMVFRSVPGFNVDVVRQSVAKDGLTARELKRIVDLVIASGDDDADDGMAS